MLLRIALVVIIGIASIHPALADQGGTLYPGIAPFISVNAKTVAIEHVRAMSAKCDRRAHAATDV
jgi:hypothetical protein